MYQIRQIILLINESLACHPKNKNIIKESYTSNQQIINMFITKKKNYVLNN